MCSCPEAENVPSVPSFHFGARYFFRSSRFGMGRRGITPFVEVLAGGSRLDTTVSGPGGFKTSVNCISYKAGGGLDFHFSPHWEVRLINVDYYRTTLGPTSPPRTITGPPLA